MSPSLLPLFYESFLSLQTGYFQPLPQFFTALGFRDEIRRHLLVFFAEARFQRSTDSSPLKIISPVSIIGNSNCFKSR